jgi:hypothetical protein
MGNGTKLGYSVTHGIEHLAQIYARGSESDPDGPEVPVPDFISIPQALSAVMTLHSYAEQQKEDFRGLIRQLRLLEREMKAQEVANRIQTTLDRFFIDKYTQIRSQRGSSYSDYVILYTRISSIYSSTRSLFATFLYRVFAVLIVLTRIAESTCPESLIVNAKQSCPIRPSSRRAQRQHSGRCSS